MKFHSIRNPAACLVAALLVLFFSPAPCCRADNGTLVAHQRRMLHTMVEIKAYGDNASAAIQEAFAEMERVNGLLNNYDPHSEVSRINQHAGQEAVAISPETFQALLAAQQFCELSRGALDITVGPLVRLWGFATEQPSLAGAVPDAGEIKSTLQLVDYRKLELKKSADGSATARLGRKGMWIEVGSFSKGYCADRAIAVLKRRGIKNALVAAGGTICALGTKADGSSWKVAVRHPRKDDFMTFVPLGDASISTSGDYERYYLKGGKRRGHILDPRTGRPVERLQSVSVIAESGLASDALATALFVAGPQKAGHLIEGIPAASALIVSADGEISMSGNWPEKIVLY